MNAKEFIENMSSEEYQKMNESGDFWYHAIEAYAKQIIKERDEYYDALVEQRRQNVALEEQIKELKLSHQIEVMAHLVSIKKNQQLKELLRIYYKAFHDIEDGIIFNEVREKAEQLLK